jgi:hypothetical protein
VPAISNEGEIIQARPGVIVFHEYGLYPGEQASLWVADLSQPSKEGEVVDVVIDDLTLCLHRSSATRRPMVGSPQMQRMHEHVARRL